METTQEFQVVGCEAITRRVKRQGNSGAVGIPVSWLGYDVVVIRLPIPDPGDVAELIRVTLSGEPSALCEEATEALEFIEGCCGCDFVLRETETGYDVVVSNAVVGCISIIEVVKKRTTSREGFDTMGIFTEYERRCNTP